MSDTYAYAPGGALKPFWQRIHRFLLLPLDRAVLYRVAGQSAAFVAAFAPLYLGTFGVVLMLLAVSATFVIGAGYGFKIVERSSRGFLLPGEYALSSDDLVSSNVPYKYVAINLLGGALVALFIMLSGGSLFIAIVAQFLVFAGLVPAATMRLVKTGSLRGALNPGEMIALVSRIGKPYAALAGFVFVVDCCRAYGLAALALSGEPATGGVVNSIRAELGLQSMVLLLLLSAGFWYFTYTICAMIGYTMFQYADQLDISIMGPGERAMRSVANARTIDVRARTRDSMIGQLVSAGDVKEAIDLLSHDFRERPHDLSLHARLHRLLIAENNTPRIEHHTDRYLALLVKSENWREALELVEESLARRASWTPSHADHIAPLAHAAVRAGKPHLAGTLIKGFDRKYSVHADIPRVYLIGAQLMAEWGGKPEEARRILEHLLQRFPADAVAPEAGRYLQVLNRTTN